MDAHYQANKVAVANWEAETVPTLFESWNEFFTAEDTKWSKQRTVPNLDAYKAILGNMWPEPLLDREFMARCFKTVDERERWGWDGAVDTAKLVNYELYNSVVAKYSEKKQ
ncbi:MAG: hypothetical protein ACYC1U_01465 [Candidatus Aquicultorales bacterium]